MGVPMTEPCSGWSFPRPEDCSTAEYLACWPGCRFCGGVDCWDWETWDGYCPACAMKYMEWANTQPVDESPSQQYKLIKIDDADEIAIWTQGATPLEVLHAAP